MTDINPQEKISLFPQTNTAEFYEVPFLFSNQRFLRFDKFFGWMIDICSDTKFRIRIEK